MPAKIKLKTSKNNASVTDYLNSIEPAAKRADGKTLLKLFKQTTGAKPKMWGGSIVGFGQYTYYRANGAEGEILATGFAMRASGPVLYIMPGYSDYSALMNKLGPHKLGKSCLYLKNLKGIDLDVLTQLIAAGVDDLKQKYTVVMN